MTTDNDRGDATPGVSETNTNRSKRSRMNKRRNNKHTTTAFEGDCSDLRGHTFVWSEIKTKKWIKSKEAFLDYVGTKYGGDEKSITQASNTNHH